jgi:isopentenyl-diphosphate delta-isomerase
MRESRKMEHVIHALRLGQSGQQGLNDIKFVPNALPETSVESISLCTNIGELMMSSPIIINAMTGGSSDTERINRELAVAAREKGLAMAVGSQMAALKNSSVSSSYEIVRKANPHGIIFANLGSEATPEQALSAVEMIEADALQIHLNVMQELIMPEGDRDFTGMLDRIGEIVRRVPVPVIVKEVGFGIMAESAAKLRTAGVSYIDVGGAGGTNFATIENARREMPLDWLNEWGGKTSVALLEAASIFPYGAMIASGGIRNSLEMAKAIALGASAVGVAGAFLKILNEDGLHALLKAIDTMEEHLKLVMTALGAGDIKQLWRAPLVIGGETAEWCRARGIEIGQYAQRRLID